jgi:hypothetical protein
MAGLDSFEEDKISCPYWDTNPGPIILLQVSIPVSKEYFNDLNFKLVLVSFMFKEICPRAQLITLRQ